MIQRNVRLSEAPSHGLPCVIYDKNCVGSKSYQKLAKEKFIIFETLINIGFSSHFFDSSNVMKL